MRIFDEPTYARLLTESLPRIIETEEENERYLVILEELDGRYDGLNPEERSLADLLTLIIQDFEDRHYHPSKAQPLDVLRLLMESNNLKQSDLVDVFGSKGITSESPERKTAPFQDPYQASKQAISAISGIVYLIGFRWLALFGPLGSCAWETALAARS